MAFSLFYSHMVLLPRSLFGIQTLPELLYTLPEAPTQLWQTLGPEKQEDYYEEDYEMSR
jgi:hypothetical protein